MVDLTIIIPVYNEIKTIEKLIKKVLKINIKKQLIIVDDCSNDGTNEILNKYLNKIDKLIIHKKNNYRDNLSLNKIKSPIHKLRDRYFDVKNDQANFLTKYSIFF